MVWEFHIHILIAHPSHYSYGLSALEYILILSTLSLKRVINISFLLLNIVELWWTSPYLSINLLNFLNFCRDLNIKPCAAPIFSNYFLINAGTDWLISTGCLTHLLNNRSIKHSCQIVRYLPFFLNNSQRSLMKCSAGFATMSKRLVRWLN